MKKTAVLLLLLAALSACGRKGPLLPPVVRVPQKPSAVTVEQRGGTFFISWANPTKNIDGSLLDAVSEIEIWVLEVEKSPASAPEVFPKTFEEKARQAALIKKDQLPSLLIEKGNDTRGYIHPFTPAASGIGKVKFVFAVRAKDARSRASEFSAFAALDFLVSPQPPRSLEVRSLKDSIELTWTAPEANIDRSVPPLVAGYNVYGQMGEGPLQRLNKELVREPKFEDRNVRYGASLRYLVRATTAETAPSIESGDSPVATIIPKDVFPPASPTGLVPIAGKGYIALSWNANQEKDLAGYRVRRKGEGEAEDILLTPQPITENAFTDRSIEKGRRYRYSISSMDKNGNESPPAEIQVESLKDDTP